MEKPNPQRRADPSKSLVGFYVGDVHYALDIARVSGIVNPLAITPLPHTPSEVTGVADHRGEVVPVLDLRVRFELPALEANRSTKWIMVQAGRHLFGLVVDRITEVFGTGDEPLAPAPPVGGKAEVRGIAGVLTHDEILTFVLDTDRFLSVVDAVADVLESVPPPKRPSGPAQGRGTKP
jgi:purine-binding chemotaxis protein CheW